MKKWLKWFLIVMWVGFLLGGGGFTALIYMVKNNAFGYFGGMPTDDDINKKDKLTELSSQLYSSDSVLLGKYFKKNRELIEYEELSPNLINALKATEDIRFEEHSGIDFRAMGRVAKGILTGDLSGGGSTVTQQLAKNLFKTRNKPEYKGDAYKNGLMRKFTIKIKEWILATRLERDYTKREIMTMYFNEVDFGSNTFGIRVASKTFFGVEPADLTVEEAAVLIGLLKAPTKYSPVLNPEASKDRRNVVLHQLHHYKYIDKATKDSLQKMPLGLHYGVEDHVGGLAPYFRTQVRNQLLYWCKKNGYDLFTDGLKIYTTIDTRLQVKAEAAVARHMKILQQRFFEHWEGKEPWRDEHGQVMEDTPLRAIKRTQTYRSLKKKYGEQQDSIDYYLNLKKPMTVFSWNGDIDTTFSSMDSIKYYMHFLHCGMVAMEPTNGHIKAWVGGINYKYFQYDHVQAGSRQPGSTFKPFIYLAAIDNGMSPCDSVLDDVVTFTVDVEGENGESVPQAWAPQNFDKVYTQRNFTLREGLATSKNVIAAKIMQRIGESTAVSYARKLGLTTDLPAVPALCLGTGEAKLIEMVAAYSTFVNEGNYNKPIFITRIEDKNGNVIASYNNIPKQVISKQSAQTMLYMLQGATSWDYRDPKTNESTGTAIRLRTRNKTELGGEEWRFTNDIGAKTGTTSNYSDGWFMAVMPNLVTGVWTGADNRNVHFRNGNYGQGSRMAMPVFGHFLKAALTDSTSGLTPVDFPEEIEKIGNAACSKGKTLMPKQNDSTNTGQKVIIMDVRDDGDPDGI